jgi:hypothetical protein
LVQRSNQSSLILTPSRLNLLRQVRQFWGHSSGCS